MEYSKLLVLSNNSFSKQNSNGRTLGGLLKGWPKDKIAQFCISSDGADYEVCNNYYCVTDGDVLKSTLKFKPAERHVLDPEMHLDSNNTADGRVKHRKTSFKMLMRNAAWMLGFWRGNEFDKWVEEFAPEIILLQSGDSYFMHHLAIKLSKKTGARLAVFNTEGYYLLKEDYFKKDGEIGKLLFKLYSKVYGYYFRKFMRKCEKQIYCNNLLKEDYAKEFGEESIVIYTPSSLVFDAKEISSLPKFTYLGNMGFDRPKALIEFANMLGEIDSRYFLDVYGYAKDEDMVARLKACKSIKFHGAVSYERVKQIINESDFLIHVESQDVKWQEALRYGFSTKIADSISSGKVFVLYSSRDIACAQYLLDNGAGIFGEDLCELKKKITDVIASGFLRKELAERARAVSCENHNPQKNVIKMREYLLG